MFTPSNWAIGWGWILVRRFSSMCPCSASPSASVCMRRPRRRARRRRTGARARPPARGDPDGDPSPPRIFDPNQARPPPRRATVELCLHETNRARTRQ
jgi:hypothetical protein